MHMHINIEKVDGPEAQPPVTGSLWNPPLGRMPIGLEGKKRCDASPNPPNAHSQITHKATCVSTRSPLSARHGRPISKRRIWHASRTKRSVSNIIGSPPNGKKRWGGGRHSDRFIPLDHPHPPGPDAHRPVPPANPKPAHQRTPHRAGCPSASRPKIFGHFSPGGTFFLRCIMNKES